MRLNQQMNLRPPGKDGVRLGPNSSELIIDFFPSADSFLKPASRELAAVPSWRHSLLPDDRIGFVKVKNAFSQ